MHPFLAGVALALSCLAAAAGTPAPAPASPAPPAPASSTWLCSLSHDLVRLVCVADDAPLAVSDPAPATTAVVNGTRFPLDPRRLWVVEMWSPATEPERVAELARATMCYRSPGCSVVMSGPLARR